MSRATPRILTTEERGKIRNATRKTDWWATATTSPKGVLYDIELAESEEDADRTVADMNARLTRARTKARCIKVKVTETVQAAKEAAQ